MYFIIPKHHAFRAIGVKAPCISVACLAGTRQPRFFQKLSPSRMKHFVQVGAYTYVGILWYKVKSAVSCRIKAPRIDYIFAYHCSSRFKPFYRIICRSSVQYYYRICLRHRIHPTVYKLRLIFTNGIYNDIHKRPPHIILIAM